MGILARTALAGSCCNQVLFTRSAEPFNEGGTVGLVNIDSGVSEVRHGAELNRSRSESAVSQCISCNHEGEEITHHVIGGVWNRTT